MGRVAGGGSKGTDRLYLEEDLGSCTAGFVQVNMGGEGTVA